MKFKTTIFLLFISFPFYNFTCGLCEGNVFSSGRSSYIATIDPQLREYKVLDTIKLGSIFDSMIPLDDGTTFDNSNLPIGFSVRFFEVLAYNEIITDGIEDFDITATRGYLREFSAPSDKSILQEVESICDNMTCGFSLDVVPKMTGLYCFQLIEVYFGNTECDNLIMINNNFGLDDNNFDLADELFTKTIRVQSAGEWYMKPAERDDLYFFKVIE